MEICERLIPENTCHTHVVLGLATRDLSLALFTSIKSNFIPQ